MARMKFLCDAERCIECNGCVTACKNENEVPWGVNRRRVVTINDGVIGAEKSISVACMHCSDAPCMAVCPVDCFYRTDDGVVLHDKDLCIGCGYCFYACPFGAPQFPQAGAFGLRGKMDKCTFCAGGPGGGPLGGRVQEVRPQPALRRQAAGLRRDVLDQGAARRRRRRDRRHLPRARHAAATRASRRGAGAPPTARARKGAAPRRRHRRASRETGRVSRRCRCWSSPVAWRSSRRDRAPRQASTRASPIPRPGATSRWRWARNGPRAIARAGKSRSRTASSRQHEDRRINQ